MWFACVLLTCFQEVYSVSVSSILRENLGVFYINNSWIIMLQGRNNSHKWQLDYLSLRKPPSSTQFGVAQLSAGPSGWVCRPTCCFHLLVLPPTKKNPKPIARFSRYSLSHNIYGLKSLWEPGFFHAKHLSPSPWLWLWLTQWRIAGCHLTTLKKKPHHVATFSQSWEETCSGRAGWYPGHLPLPQPEPCLENSPLAPPPAPLPLPIFIEGGGTLSCSCLTSNPREVLRSI